MTSRPIHPLQPSSFGVLLAALVCAIPVAAQESIPEPTAPIQLAPQQPAFLMDGWGSVHFPVHCSQDDTRRMFQQGVAMLHCRWYLEAERSFRQVIAVEPDCALGYWGMAMANVHNPDRAAWFVEDALLHGGGHDEREKALVGALAAFYEVTEAGARARPAPQRKENAATKELVRAPKRTFRAGWADRARRLAEAYRALTVRWPKDLELLALSVDQDLRNSCAGASDLKPQQLDARLGKVLARYAAHPVLGDRVRIWLTTAEPDSRRLLDAVGMCAQSAPAFGGVYTLAGRGLMHLHRYADAVPYLESAARVFHGSMHCTWAMPYEVPEYAANGRLWIRCLAATGQVRRALQCAAELLRLPRHPRDNAPGQPGSIAFHGLGGLLETCVDYGMAAELQKLEAAGVFGGKDDRRHPDQIAALAAACFLLGDVTRGKIHMQALPVSADRDQRAERLLAIRAVAERRNDARQQLDRVDLSPSLRADCLRSLGDLAHARVVIDLAAKQRPNQVPILARQVLLRHATGDVAGARAAFDRLRVVGGHADLDVPLLASLAPVARALGLPEDWRTPGAAPADLGPRPDLARLGPAHWEPREALDWELPGLHGKMALKDFRGRPVLVILYLGFGCVHCVEQLRDFHPLVKRYRAQGLEILAIGIDSARGMRAAMADLPATERYAFSMLSDRKLHVFREWLAFDRFEHLPLHGTYLVDAAGRIRWRDIGDEPFTAPVWLLAECRRLLTEKKR